MATVQVKFGERLLRLRPQSMTTNNLAMIFKLDINRGIYLNSEEEGEIILPSIGIENNGLPLQIRPPIKLRACHAGYF